MYGKLVVSSLIKQKKYRKEITDFIDQLRLSKNFRDRQMYIKIAKSTFKADNEIFKKHFAKSIATDMETEKVKVVQIALAKMLYKVPNGYSRSCEKMKEKMLKECSEDVK